MGLPTQRATTTNASTAAPEAVGDQRNNLGLMAPSGSSQQPPGGATPEEVALWGFPPDAGTYADGVSYFQNGIAAVTVSFPGNRPSLTQLDLLGPPVSGFCDKFQAAIPSRALVT